MNNSKRSVLKAALLLVQTVHAEEQQDLKDLPDGIENNSDQGRAMGEAIVRMGYAMGNIIHAGGGIIAMGSEIVEDKVDGGSGVESDSKVGDGVGSESPGL